MKLGNELHEHLVEWLKANGVNPHDVPTDAQMTYDGRELVTDLYVTTEDGKRLLAPGRDELAVTTGTFTITVEPPPDVAWWLRGRCPTCGR